VPSMVAPSPEPGIPSEPPTSFESVPSEPMISSEPVAAVEPVVGQSAARHEEPAPPAEPDHRDE
jgi:hypothetical protein